MKRILSISVFAAVLLHDSLSLAQNELNDWNWADQLAFELQVAPSGRAEFDDIPSGYFEQATFGIGWYNPRDGGFMLRNNLGLINRSLLSYRRIALIDGIEIIFIKPFAKIFTDNGHDLSPYFGFGFSLTVLQDNADRSRGYSAWMLETGMDIAEKEDPEIFRLRISLKVAIGFEHQTILLALGGLIHPVPIIDRCLF